MKKFFLSVLLLLSALFVLQACNYKKSSEDRNFINENQAKISQIIIKQLDPKQQHLHKISIENNTVKGYYDNGGDVGGNYHLDFTAYANDNKHYQLTCHINFLDATIGPFTFKQPDPYDKPENMTFDSVDFETKDLSSSKIMNSWWNWNDSIYLDNFGTAADKLDSKEHQELEAIYIYHQDNIRAAFLTYLKSTNPKVSISQLTESNPDLGYFAIGVNGSNLYDDALYLTAFYQYTLDGKETEDDSSVDFYVTKANLKNMTAPLTVEIGGQKQNIPADSDQIDKAAKIAAFHAAIAPAIKASINESKSQDTAISSSENKENQQKAQLLKIYKVHQKGLLALAKSTAGSTYHKVAFWTDGAIPDGHPSDYDFDKGTAQYTYECYKKATAKGYPDTELDIEITFDPKKLDNPHQTIKVRVGIYNENKKVDNFGDWQTLKSD